MQKLVFDRGYKEYQIGDDENAVIRINTTDVGILARLNEAVKNIEQIQKKYENAENTDAIQLITECDKDIREQINYIFGSDVCTVAFGEINCLSLVGGKPIFENFLEVLIPVMQADFESAQKNSNKKVGKYTSQVKK